MVARARGSGGDAYVDVGTFLRSGEALTVGDFDGKDCDGELETGALSLSGARRFRPGADAIASPCTLYTNARIVEGPDLPDDA